MSSKYGHHLSYPFRVGQDGRTAQVTALEPHVRDELMQLLLTNIGERAFLPEFGGGVRNLVFEPADEATRGMTKARITKAISNYLGHRITLEDLSVNIEGAMLTAEIRYRIAGTEDSRVMRFQRMSE
ncbi:MAG: hypothetical protein GTO14_14285 [Anaerolineales bacterium]|nr:hypothetical protein [Anaerolineales bacterium]